MEWMGSRHLSIDQCQRIVHTHNHSRTHAALDIVYEHDESTARTSYINKHLDKERLGRCLGASYVAATMSNGQPVVLVGRSWAMAVSDSCRSARRGRTCK